MRSSPIGLSGAVAAATSWSVVVLLSTACGLALAQEPQSSAAPPTAGKEAKPAAAKPAPAKPKAAVIDVAEADQDYAYQGEFVGHVGGFGSLGLQVVALGGGKFDAVAYPGGLPGAGWSGGTRHKLAGVLEGALLWLDGPALKIGLSALGGTVFSPTGATLGSLRKLQRQSPTMGLAAPAGATVLFSGELNDQLKGGKLAPDGSLISQPQISTAAPVGDFRLHLEFRTPYMPAARGQARGNSGVYIQQRYEVQILDSFGLEGVDNECGGLYKQQKPDLNMCLPPLAWQTYDIYFTAARFSPDGKTKLSPARITVLHNGVAIHNQRELKNKTGGGKQEGPEPFPINLQDHGNPVTFRNIWIAPLAGHPGAGPSAVAGQASACCTTACTRCRRRR